MITLTRKLAIVRRYAFPRLGLDPDTVLEVAADAPVDLTAWAQANDVDPAALAADLARRGQFKADVAAGRLVLSGWTASAAPPKKSSKPAAQAAV